MNDFKDVLDTLKDTIPDLASVPCKRFIIPNNPKFNITVARPEPFNNYMDIVARVTLSNDSTVLWDVLITCDTNLTAFCDKIKKKIETNEIRERIEQHV